jgi:hypothetical protein
MSGPGHDETESLIGPGSEALHSRFFVKLNNTVLTKPRRRPKEFHGQPMLQISAQTWNVWLLEALCSAAVT